MPQIAPFYIAIPFHQLFTRQYSTNSMTGACKAPNISDVGKSVASSKSN